MNLYDIIYLEISYYSKEYSDVIIEDKASDIQVTKELKNVTKDKLKEFCDKYQIIFNDFENMVSYNEE